ncbi:uncharacterized protein [Scyliorhinus torazame]|uniref:uncharacterized protein isoform X3 n=1 Tax=Scyliorhinus torazame TaxID=75743 RepID=UPI003B5C1AA1
MQHSTNRRYSRPRAARWCRRRGPGFDPGPGSLSMWSSHILPVSAKVSPPRAKDVQDVAGCCDNIGIIGNVDVITSNPPALGINNRGPELVSVVDIAPNQTAFEEGKKEKESMKRQGSETTTALEPKVSNQFRETASGDDQSSARALTLLPAHAKKFDTILRSGVSVQELRAQVLARLSDAGQKKPATQVEGLAAQSNSLRLLGRPEQKAARQDALQRLGLLKCTGGLSNISNSSTSPQPLVTEGTPQPPTEKDHKEALKKLGLLNLES